MHLIERFISLSVFTLLTGITLAGVACLRGKQYKIVLLMYWLGLAVLAYFFIPETTMDLYRLHQSCGNGFCLYSWKQLLYILPQTSTPAWLLYGWGLFQVFGQVDWLQTVTWLWGGFNILYIVTHTIDSDNITHKNRALLLFSVIAIGSFYSGLMIGLRNILSFSIILWCFYRETLENKSFLLHLPFYFFAALLHQAGLVLVLIRVAFLFSVYKNILVRYVLLCIIGGAFVFLFVHGNFFVDKALDKAYSYSTDPDEYVYYWSMLIAFINQVQIALILYNYKRKITLCLLHLNPFFYMSLLLLVISLAALPFSFAIFSRFTLASSLLTVPLLGKLLAPQLHLRNKLLVQSLWLLGIVIFFLSISRGNLCGYKFFVL